MEKKKVSSSLSIKRSTLWSDYFIIRTPLDLNFFKAHPPSLERTPCMYILKSFEKGSTVAFMLVLYFYLSFVYSLNV